MPASRAGGPANWLKDKDRSNHQCAYDPGGLELESLPARHRIKYLIVRTPNQVVQNLHKCHRHRSIIFHALMSRLLAVCSASNEFDHLSCTIEIGNALSAMFKRRSIGLDAALELLDAYAAIPIRLIDMALKQAVELSARLNVYAYDAYVIACALNQRAPLLTLDKGLIERARDLKLDVLGVNVS
jgi:predicted nucleic acid-binding protein